jgi:hypothetical protein
MKTLKPGSSIPVPPGVEEWLAVTGRLHVLVGDLLPGWNNVTVTNVAGRGNIEVRLAQMDRPDTSTQLVITLEIPPRVVRRLEPRSAEDLVAIAELERFERLELEEMVALESLETSAVKLLAAGATEIRDPVVQHPRSGLFHIAYGHGLRTYCGRHPDDSGRAWPVVDVGGVDRFCELCLRNWKRLHRPRL